MGNFIQLNPASSLQKLRYTLERLELVGTHPGFKTLLEALPELPYLKALVLSEAAAVPSLFRLAPNLVNLDIIASANNPVLQGIPEHCPAIERIKVRFSSRTISSRTV